MASWSAMTFGAERGCPVSLSFHVTICSVQTKFELLSHFQRYCV